MEKVCACWRQAGQLSGREALYGPGSLLGGFAQETCPEADLWGGPVAGVTWGHPSAQQRCGLTDGLPGGVPRTLERWASEQRQAV